MDINNLIKIIDSYYFNIDGFKVSQNAIKKYSYFYSGYIYGEATTQSFCKIMSILKPKNNETFYDLGCGIGKKIITAALLYPNLQYVGIEKVKELFDIAYIISKKINRDYNLKTKIIHEDFRTFNFLDADIVYFSYDSKSINYEITNYLGKKFDSLKIGARLFTVNTPYISNKYDIIYKEDLNWVGGLNTAIVQIKRN